MKIGCSKWHLARARSVLSPHLPALADPLLTVSARHLANQHRQQTSWNHADRDFSQISLRRERIRDETDLNSATAEDVLIDLALSALTQLARTELKRAETWFDLFASSDVPTLRRIARSAMVDFPGMTPDQKIEWLIATGSLLDSAVYPETCELINNDYPRTSTEARRKLIRAIRDAVSADETEVCDVASSELQLYDWFDILLRADPECELAEAAFQELQDKHPEWETREHPDLRSRVIGAYYVRRVSPWTIDELLSRPGSAWVDDILGFEPPASREFVGDGHMDEKRAAQAVRVAATAKARWGIEFCDPQRVTICGTR